MVPISLPLFAPKCKYCTLKGCIKQAYMRQGRSIDVFNAEQKRIGVEDVDTHFSVVLAFKMMYELLWLLGEVVNVRRDKL